MPSFTQASKMPYNSSTEIEKGGGIPLLYLLLPLVAFFSSSTIAASTFLLSCFKGFLGALVICEVKPLEGFLTDMLVLLNASITL